MDSRTPGDWSPLFPPWEKHALKFGVASNPQYVYRRCFPSEYVTAVLLQFRRDFYHASDGI